MDLELLKLRAVTMQRIRSFFIKNGYLELDTPALSSTLIPETRLEVFRTDYIEPWSGMSRPLYLVPSPEIYLNRIIAQHKVSVFQLSKCYRNVEPMERVHNPEFTVLEYYTMKTDYLQAVKITESLFSALMPQAQGVRDPWAALRPPFVVMSMNKAFEQYTGLALSSVMDVKSLANHTKSLGIAEPADRPFDAWSWPELYKYVFTQYISPKLPVTKPVVITDYPVKETCLAKDVPNGGNPPVWKQRWELFANGMELANGCTEENDPERIRIYFETEGIRKQKTAKVPHAIDGGYWKIFKDYPPCSGVSLGFDRLLTLMAGQKTVSSVLPFTL